VTARTPLIVEFTFNIEDIVKLSNEEQQNELFLNFLSVTKLNTKKPNYIAY
jgi:hypothetical protein